MTDAKAVECSRDFTELSDFELARRVRANMRKCIELREGLRIHAEGDIRTSKPDTIVHFSAETLRLNREWSEYVSFNLEPLEHQLRQRGLEYMIQSEQYDVRVSEKRLNTALRTVQRTMLTKMFRQEIKQFVNELEKMSRIPR